MNFEIVITLRTFIRRCCRHMSYVVRYKLAIGAVGIVAVSFVAAMAHAAIDSQVLISGQQFHRHGNKTL